MIIADSDFKITYGSKMSKTYKKQIMIIAALVHTLETVLKRL